MANMMLEHRLTIPGTQPLAVDDTYASHASPQAIVEKFSQFPFGIRFGQAMQIQFRLAYPLAAPQSPQDLPRDAGSDIGSLVAGFLLLIPLEGVMHGCMDDFTFVPQPVQGEGRQPQGRVKEAAMMAERLYILSGGPE